MRMLLVGVLLSLVGWSLSAVAADVLRVVATTTIVGDVVRAIGGDRIRLTVLLAPGADPHGYQATPRDLVALSEADVVFVNGAGLEAGLADLVANATGKTVTLADRLALRELGAHPDDHDAADHEDDHDHGGTDPHVWFDPTNLMIWADAIDAELSKLDPIGATAYGQRSAAYRNALIELDGWIWAEVSKIPRDRRLLVTDHLAFGYFAARYGFEVVGAVIPGFSTLAEPSARELAALIDAVKAQGVRAIFIGTTVSPVLAQTVTAETATALVTLYTGSLGVAGGGAESYIEMMQTNVARIVAALAP